MFCHVFLNELYSSSKEVVKDTMTSARQHSIRLTPEEKEVLNECQKALYGEKDAQYIPMGSTIERLAEQQLRRLVALDDN
jgi:hypothetical protein